MEPAKLHKSAGELVLQNGRQAGARRALGEPITFIGRAQDCDVRLNVDGVDPLHCLLVFGPAGLQMRDLNSVHGTQVNGVRTDAESIANGDVLKIGPFQFRVELPPPAEVPADDLSTDEQREALRIQASAVAAQQAALDEEEARLQQRRNDLQQQEEQLAAHLAEKQRQVQLWSDYTKAERETLRKEKLEQDKRLAKLEAELVKAKQDVSTDHQKLTQERQRIHRVYHRLRQRWQKQWAAEKEKHQKLARKLHADTLALEDRQRALQAREASLNQDILRFNTDRELGTRQLRDERVALNKAQATWRRRRSHEFLVLKGMQRQADETQLRLKDARQTLVAEKDAWDQQFNLLQKELHGLNSRIIHQRARVQEQSAEIARLDGIMAERKKQVDDLPSVAAPVATDSQESVPECDVDILPDEPAPETVEPQIAPDDWQRRFDGLTRLASDLADQRAHLLEQYQRLTEIQETWERQRDHAAAEIERLARRLLEQEQSLSTRDQHCSAVETTLQRRQQESDALREEVQVWRAQLKARETILEEEHARNLQALRQKEAILQEQLVQLAEVRQRWNQRRQQEVEQMRSQRAELDEQHKETQKRRVAIFEKTQQLEEEKRIQAEKSLALEQYRQEIFFRANDPAAQRRVERLRRRWLTVNAALIRNAKAEREAVGKDLQALDIQRAEAEKLLELAAQTDASLADRQTALEEQESELNARRALWETELGTLQNQRTQETHLRLQDQIDALAKAVYDEPNSSAIDQAA